MRWTRTSEARRTLLRGTGVVVCAVCLVAFAEIADGAGNGQTGVTDSVEIARINPGSGATVESTAIIQSVKNAEQFRQAVAAAGPNTTILVAPGAYADSMHFSDVQGAEGAPVVIAALDPDDPPVFQSLQLSDAVHLELRNLTFRGRPRTD